MAHAHAVPVSGSFKCFRSPLSSVSSSNIHVNKINMVRKFNRTVAHYGISIELLVNNAHGFHKAHIKCEGDELLKFSLYKKPSLSSRIHLSIPVESLMNGNLNSSCKLSEQSDHVSPSGLHPTLRLLDPHKLAYSSRVKLICEWNRHVNYVKWFKSGESLLPDHFVSDQILVIENFSLGDLGEYHCQTYGPDGMFISNSINLFHDTELAYRIGQVKDANAIVPSPIPFDPRLKFKSHSQHIKVGDFLAVECLNPDFNFIPKWFKLTKTDGLIEMGEKELRFGSLGPESRGVFICKTVGRQGEQVKIGFRLDMSRTTKYFRLRYIDEKQAEHLGTTPRSITSKSSTSTLSTPKANAPPDVQLIIADRTSLAQGERAEIICRADANATVSWIKMPNKVMKTTPDDTLILTPIKPSDLGRYRCYAHNAFGARFRDVLLSKSSDGVEFIIFGFVDHMPALPRLT